MSELTPGTVPSAGTATKSLNDQSEHQATLQAVISGTEPIKYRARKLIAFLSKSSEVVSNNWSLTAEALDTITTGLSTERYTQLRYDWQDVDLTPRGAFWRLCKLTARAHSLNDAFKRTDYKEFSRQCETDTIDEVAIDEDHQTRLNNFFQPWNLVDRAIAASDIGDDWEVFVMIRAGLRSLHPKWMRGVSLEQKNVFDVLDWPADSAEQDEENEEDARWRPYMDQLRDPNSDLRQTVSSLHFDPKADVLEGPEVRDATHRGATFD